MGTQQRSKQPVQQSFCSSYKRRFRPSSNLENRIGNRWEKGEVILFTLRYAHTRSDELTTRFFSRSENSMNTVTITAIFSPKKGPAIIITQQVPNWNAPGPFLHPRYPSPPLRRTISCRPTYAPYVDLRRRPYFQR